MKRCPACQTTYTDNSLRYCLTDGNLLEEETAETATVVRPGGRTEASIDPPSSGPGDSRSSASTFVKIAVAIVLLGFVALAALGLAGAVFYYGSGGSLTEQSKIVSTPTPSPRPTADLEKERMKDELANIKKKLDDQDSNADEHEDDREPAGDFVYATAHSPSDGFLALRSTPNAETGTRMAKIPHGARIEIGGCKPYTTTGRGTYGRWCRARYDGLTGWVFDAFVKY